MTDNGIGRQKALALREASGKNYPSKGMELLSKRFALLSQQYGKEIEISVQDLMQDGHAAGTSVQITLPLSIALPYQQLQYETSDYH